jgi:hypothetical protein
LEGVRLPQIAKSDSTARTFSLAAILAIPLIALALRLYRIEHASLSLDESFTLFFSSKPWPTLWSEVIQHDVQPPLYYTIVKLFGGASEAALRLPSAFMGALSVAVTFWAGLVAGGPKGRIVGCVAALAVTFATPQVYIGQSARHYSMFVLAMAMTLVGLLGLFAAQSSARSPSGPRDKAKRPRNYLFTTTCALGLAWVLWTHNVGVVYVFSLGSAALLAWVLFERRNAALLVQLVVAGTAALLLWAPAIPILVRQLRSISGNYWIESPTWESLLLLIRRNFALVDHIGLPIWVQAVLGGIISLLALWGAWSMWLDDRRSIALICVAATVVPLFLLTVYSIVATPVLMLRVVLPTFIPWVILIGYGIASLPSALQRLAAATLVIGTFAAGLPQHYGSRGEPWAEIAANVAADSNGTPVVFTVPNTSALPLGYYADRLGVPFEIVPVPGPFPAVDANYVYPTGVVGVPGIEAGGLAHIDAILSSRRDATVWITLRGYPIYDRQGALKRHLEQSFCHIRVDDGSIWYLMVLRLVPLDSADATRCDPRTNRLYF